MREIIMGMRKWWCCVAIVLSFALSAHDLPEENLAVHEQHLNAAISAYERSSLPAGHHISEETREQIFALERSLLEEQAKWPEYYSVITAQGTDLIGYQIVAKELFEKLHDSVWSDFEFLRYPDPSLSRNRHEFFAKYPTFTLPQQTLEMLFEAAENTGVMPVPMDLEPAISKEIISANLGLETYVPLDSALFVLLTGKGVISTVAEEAPKQHLREYLADMFALAGVTQERYMPELDALVAHVPKAATGMVMQILIPRERAEELLYFSYPGGFVREEQDARIAHIFEQFQQSHLSAQFDVEENTQVRVIAGGLFDPSIKVIRHTSLTEEEISTYQAYVHAVIERMLQ